MGVCLSRVARAPFWNELGQTTRLHTRACARLCGQVSLDHELDTRACDCHVTQVNSLPNFHMAWHTGVSCGRMDKSKKPGKQGLKANSKSTHHVVHKSGSIPAATPTTIQFGGSTHQRSATICCLTEAAPIFLINVKESPSSYVKVKPIATANSKAWTAARA
ncbi:Transcription initiation factor IIE subunit beta [Gossypium arboreum]|uniref:Transcription initiation factor IIE subunit beta n=1 Tax=Gossypium arboreum TaxID=29729 RepID=A0A0B0PR60_GOSAR|nr:Transcription initiation factor IIE subunit beta [Gossypium arboreum]